MLPSLVHELEYFTTKYDALVHHQADDSITISVPTMPVERMAEVDRDLSRLRIELEKRTAVNP